MHIVSVSGHVRNESDGTSETTQKNERCTAVG